MLSGIPKEVLDNLISSIISQYFGNEKIMSAIMEIHHTKKTIKLREILEILFRIAIEYDVQCHYDISDELLDKNLNIKADAIKFFTNIVNKKSVSELDIEATLSSSGITLYFMYNGHVDSYYFAF